jgi:hypothetical protein
LWGSKTFEFVAAAAFRPAMARGGPNALGEVTARGKTLRVTPAMAAGVTNRLWEIGDMVTVLESWEQSDALQAD